MAAGNVSLERGWHFANLLPSNQLCQFIRGDEYTYFTSNENAIHDNADYHHCTALSHCYRNTLILGTVWWHNNTQVWNTHINIAGITTLVFLVLVLVKKNVAAEHRSQFCEMSVAWLYFGGQLAPTPMDILYPGRVFCGKLRSVYVVKCVWSSLTDLLFNRLVFLVRICDKLVSAPGGTTFL